MPDATQHTAQDAARYLHSYERLVRIIERGGQTVLVERDYHHPKDIADMADACTALLARVQALEAALRDAIEHTDELEEAWRRGVINELDHMRMGGTRANRNVEVNRKARAVLAGAAAEGV